MGRAEPLARGVHHALHVVNGMVLHLSGASAKLINILILESVSGEHAHSETRVERATDTRAHFRTRSAGHSMY